MKINEAYENFGERGAVRTVKRLLSTPGKPFPINHVITVDFGGFRRAIDYIGCVYADIDRDYFNDRGGPGGYAVIDIDPGYQKICGKDALAYVRYRHTDNDLVRAARQQDFLRQVRNRRGRASCASAARARQPQASWRGCSRATSTRDKSLHQKKEVFKFAKTVLFTASNPVREVRFRVVERPTTSTSSRRRTCSARRSPSSWRQGLGDRRASRPSRRRPRSRRRRSARSARRTSRPSIKGLEEARAEGENQAIVGARKIDFPFYFPTLRTSAAAYQGQEPRTYKIKDERGQASTTPTGSCSPRASSASTTGSRA